MAEKGQRMRRKGVVADSYIGRGEGGKNNRRWKKDTVYSTYEAYYFCCTLDIYMRDLGMEKEAQSVYQDRICNVDVVREGIPWEKGLSERVKGLMERQPLTVLSKPRLVPSRKVRQSSSVLP